MAQEQEQYHSIPQQQRPAGWLSFTALFSDGDRLRQASSPSSTSLAPPPAAAVQRRPPLEDYPDDGGSNPDDVVAFGQTEELADMRLDISDLQDAVKNHDLWVQDAVAMRQDIEEIQKSIGDHEGWMQNLSSVVRQIQAREDYLAKNVADLRHQVGLVGLQSKAVASQALPATAGGDPESTGPLLWNGAQTDSAIFEADGRQKLSMLRTTEFIVSEPVGMTNGTKGESSLAENEMQKLVMGLNKQLNSGLRMLRTMVTAVEGSLLRQIDSERTNRRTAIAELRGEFSRLRDGTMGHVGNMATVGATSSNQSSLGALRETVNGLERRTADKAAEVERMVLGLRTELTALRTEQQLQAVAASALALTQGTCNGEERSRILSKLGGEHPAHSDLSLASGSYRSPRLDDADLDARLDSLDTRYSKRAYSCPPADGDVERKTLLDHDRIREARAVHAASSSDSWRIPSTTGRLGEPTFGIGKQRGAYSGYGSAEPVSWPGSQDYYDGLLPDRPEENKAMLRQGAAALRAAQERKVLGATNG